MANLHERKKLNDSNEVYSSKGRFFIFKNGLVLLRKADKGGINLKLAKMEALNFTPIYIAEGKVKASAANS